MMFPATNFVRSEFECHCGCGFDVVDAELLNVLNRMREDIGNPVIIMSGARCAKHNKMIKGVDLSQHLLGKASDVRVKYKLPKDVYKYLDTMYPDQYGIGLYETFVHIDVRSVKARWVG